MQVFLYSNCVAHQCLSHTGCHIIDNSEILGCPFYQGALQFIQISTINMDLHIRKAHISLMQCLNVNYIDMKMFNSSLKTDILRNTLQRPIQAKAYQRHFFTDPQLGGCHKIFPIPWYKLVWFTACAIFVKLKKLSSRYEVRDILERTA